MSPHKNECQMFILHTIYTLQSDNLGEGGSLNCSPLPKKFPGASLLHTVKHLLPAGNVFNSTHLIYFIPVVGGPASKLLYKLTEQAKKKEFSSRSPVIKKSYFFLFSFEKLY